MKRGGLPRVLLADADFLSGSVGFQLKLKNDFHFGHAAEDGLRLDEDLWSRMITPAEGLDVLLAPEDPSTPLAPDRAAVAALLSYMREHYDAAVLDLPGAPTAVTAGFAGQAEVLLVVTTNELAALHTTRRSIESLEHAGIDRTRLRLILNRYLPGAGLKREDVRTALRIEPAAVLGNDYQAVQEAILAGKPVSHSAAFSRGVQALARQLAGKAETAPAAQTRSWLRFLGRRT
jgi:pilus assembly protein CpaE